MFVSTARKKLNAPIEAAGGPAETALLIDGWASWDQIATTERP